MAKRLQYHTAVGVRPTKIPGTELEIDGVDLILVAPRPLPGRHTFYITAGVIFVDAPDKPSNYVPAGLGFPSFYVSQWFPLWGFHSVLRVKDWEIDPDLLRKNLYDALSLDAYAIHYITEEAALAEYRRGLVPIYGAERVQEAEELIKDPYGRERAVAYGRELLTENEVWKDTDSHKFWNTILTWRERSE